MSLVLYHSPISTCSQKVRLVLAEKGLAFDSQVLDLSQREHLSDHYLSINPNGVVPTLVHEGNPIVDSSVICEYLDETFPADPLSPKDALGKSKMRAWMRYSEEVPTTAIRVPSFNMRFQHHIGALPEEVFDAMVEKMPLRKQMYREMGQNGFSDQKFDESMERLRACAERMSNALSDGRVWLLGDQYSIADIVLVPTLVRIEDLNLAYLWDDLPLVKYWLGRVMARPSFDIAYYPGTRIV